MQETINLIEQRLGENKEVLRRLSDEQEKLISMLTDGYSKKKQLANENYNLERQLKDLCDQQSDRKTYFDLGMTKEMSLNKMVRQQVSQDKARDIERAEDIYKAEKR